jgi:hypothetical protein
LRCNDVAYTHRHFAYCRVITIAMEHVVVCGCTVDAARLHDLRTTPHSSVLFCCCFVVAVKKGAGICFETSDAEVHACTIQPRHLPPALTFSMLAAHIVDLSSFLPFFKCLTAAVMVVVVAHAKCRIVLDTARYSSSCRCAVLCVSSDDDRMHEDAPVGRVWHRDAKGRHPSSQCDRAAAHYHWR